MLEHRIAGMIDNQKFVEVAHKYGSRVMFQRQDPCPNGKAGCKVCKSRFGYRTGYHPRPMEVLEVTDTLLHEPSGTGGWIYETLSHRWRLIDQDHQPSVTVGNRVLIYGTDFTFAERRVVFLTDPPERQQKYTVHYWAYKESSMHMGHVKLDTAGGKAQGERSLNLPYVGLDQGSVSVSVGPETGSAYHLKEGDLFIPSDATMRFQQTFQVSQFTVWKPRHNFIHRIETAYYLNGPGDTEVFVDGFTYNEDTHRFVPPAGIPDKANVVILYDAAPMYFVWLDVGEFRSMGMEQKPRLALLSRYEVST